MSWLSNLRANIAGEPPITSEQAGQTRAYAWAWKGLRVAAALVAVAAVGLAGFWLGERQGHRQAMGEAQPLLDTLLARPIAVASVYGWQPTKLRAEAGDRVFISVIGGEVPAWRPRIPPEIIAQLPTEVLETLPFGQDDPLVEGPPPSMAGLVARIGGGPPIDIGTSKIFTASSSGEISLGIGSPPDARARSFDTHGDVLEVQIMIDH